MYYHKELHRGPPWWRLMMIRKRPRWLWIMLGFVVGYVAGFVS